MNKIQNHVKEQKVVLIKKMTENKINKAKISKKRSQKENNGQNTRDKTQKLKTKKNKLAKTNSATEQAMRQALEKDRLTFTNNCKPCQNPTTRPLEPERANQQQNPWRGP